MNQRNFNLNTSLCYLCRGIIIYVFNLIASDGELSVSESLQIDVADILEQKFDQAVNKQQQVQIGSKEQAINKLEETIKAKAEQIKRLTQEIEQHQKERDQLKNEIKEAVVKVESTKNDFIASYNNLVNQIHEDMENIKKYLK